MNRWDVSKSPNTRCPPPHPCNLRCRETAAYLRGVFLNSPQHALCHPFKTTCETKTFRQRNGDFRPKTRVFSFTLDTRRNMQAEPPWGHVITWYRLVTEGLALWGVSLVAGGGVGARPEKGHIFFEGGGGVGLFRSWTDPIPWSWALPIFDGAGKSAFSCGQPFIDGHPPNFSFSFCNLATRRKLAIGYIFMWQLGRSMTFRELWIGDCLYTE